MIVMSTGYVLCALPLVRGRLTTLSKPRKMSTKLAMSSVFGATTTVRRLRCLPTTTHTAQSNATYRLATCSGARRLSMAAVHMQRSQSPPPPSSTSTNTTKVPETPPEQPHPNDDLHHKASTSSPTASVDTNGNKTPKITHNFTIPSDLRRTSSPLGSPAIPGHVPPRRRSVRQTLLKAAQIRNRTLANSQGIPLSSTSSQQKRSFPSIIPNDHHNATQMHILRPIGRSRLTRSTRLDSNSISLADNSHAIGSYNTGAGHGGNTGDGSHYMGYTSWRMARAALLDSVQGFWPRTLLRIRLFLKGHMFPRWRLNDVAVMFSWLFVGNTLLLVVGTTTFFSLVLLTLNTMRAQAYFAQILSDYLTKQTGFEISFQSAIVPRWAEGVIRLSNVSIVCNDETWIKLRRKLWIESGYDPLLFDPEKVDTNWTFWDITVRSVDVKLSFYKFLEGKGFVDECSMKGVRGVIDRRHVYWPDDWVPTRRIPQEGDFQIDGFVLEDLFVTICHPNFRPYNISVYRAELPLLRKQWLLYDFMRANSMNGSIENCLFSVHKPQRHDIIIDDEYKERRRKSGSVVGPGWERVSHLKLNGLPIDHLNGGAEGPFGWITSGTLDIDLQFMFPQVNDTDLIDVLRDGVSEFKEISKLTMDHVSEDGLVSLLKNKNFRAWLELRKERLVAKIRESNEDGTSNIDKEKVKAMHRAANTASLVADTMVNDSYTPRKDSKQLKGEIDSTLFGSSAESSQSNRSVTKARIANSVGGYDSGDEPVSVPHNNLLEQKQQDNLSSNGDGYEDQHDIVVVRHGDGIETQKSNNSNIEVTSATDYLKKETENARLGDDEKSQDGYIPSGVGVRLMSLSSRTQGLLKSLGYDYLTVANPKESQIELFPERDQDSTRVVKIPPLPNKPNEMLMLWQVRLNDVKANIPLHSDSISYMNAALIQPIVSYMNSSRTDISIAFGAAMDLSNFDGAWTVFSAGLIDVLSEQVGRAVTNMYLDERERMRHLRRIGLVSFQSVLRNIVGFLEYARPYFLSSPQKSQNTN